MIFASTHRGQNVCLFWVALPALSFKDCNFRKVHGGEQDVSSTLIFTTARSISTTPAQERIASLSTYLRNQVDLDGTNRVV